MKKNIGSVVALYPTPLVVVGVMMDDKPNWVLVGHVGIIGHDRILVSLAKPHHTNKGIKEKKILSVNIVDESLLEQADYVGTVSGAQEDKSGVFEYSTGNAGAPLIGNSPVSMECSVDDMYETSTFESFILKIENTYVDDTLLKDDGKISYQSLKPVLFEMPTYEYLRTGDVIGKCKTFGKSR